MSKNFLKGNYGSSPILLVVIILISILTIGIALTDFKIPRLKFAFQSQKGDKTQQLAQTAKFNILNSISSGSCSDTVYNESTLYDCSASDKWNQVNDTDNNINYEYCIVFKGSGQNPIPNPACNSSSIKKYVVRARIIGDDLVQTTDLTVGDPEICTCGTGTTLDACPPGSEECDLGEVNSNNSACTSSCQIAECGDQLTCSKAGCETLVLGRLEECDSGSFCFDTTKGESDPTAYIRCFGPSQCDGTPGTDQNCEPRCLPSSHPDFENCSDQCSLIVCGNFIKECGEECDPGESDSAICDCETWNGSACIGSQACTDRLCGDGYYNAHPSSGEECDDGDQSTPGGTADVTWLTNPSYNSGDCVIDYSVDGGDPKNPTVSCKDAFCGDGYLDTDGVNNSNESGAGDDEQCDDGNSDPCDGCNNSCKTYSPTCGDGVVECNEQCDDGEDPPQSGTEAPLPKGKSDDEGDAVNDGLCIIDLLSSTPNPGSSCKDSFCGDYYLCDEAACEDGTPSNNRLVEACDDGADSVNCDFAGGNDDVHSCTLADCGDGYPNLAAGEECDDADASETYCNESAGCTNPLDPIWFDDDGPCVIDFGVIECKNNDPNDGYRQSTEICDDNDVDTYYTANPSDNDGLCVYDEVAPIVPKILGELSICGDGYLCNSSSNPNCNQGGDRVVEACDDADNDTKFTGYPGQVLTDAGSCIIDSANNNLCIVNPAICGDGYRNGATEECDDANISAGLADHCTNNGASLGSCKTQDCSDIGLVDVNSPEQFSSINDVVYLEKQNNKLYAATGGSQSSSITRLYVYNDNPASPSWTPKLTDLTNSCNGSFATCTGGTPGRLLTGMKAISYGGKNYIFIGARRAGGTPWAWRFEPATNQVYYLGTLDFTIAAEVHDFAYYNGAIYASTGRAATPGRFIYKWNGLTGGSSSWTILTMMSTDTRHAYALKVFESRLFVAIGRSGGDAEVWSCGTCDAQLPSIPDWRLEGDNVSNSDFWQFDYGQAFDLYVYNSSLYVGVGGPGDVYKYNAQHDWTLLEMPGSTDRIESLGSFNNKLYAGTGASHELWEYTGSSWQFISQVGSSGLNITSLIDYDDGSDLGNALYIGRDTTRNGFDTMRIYKYGISCKLCDFVGGGRPDCPWSE